MARTLCDLANKYDFNYKEASRVLSTSSSFPIALKNLFGVEKPAESNYQIRTSYPRLLSNMLSCVKQAPFSPAPQTAVSYQRNENFLMRCIPKKLCGNHQYELSDLEEFYLLERLFRLDSKRYLFKNYFSIPDIAYPLSPPIVADILFHSPIVFYPAQDFLNSGLLCRESKQQKSTFVFRANFLHSVFQIDSFAFPFCFLLMCGFLLNRPSAQVLDDLAKSKWLSPGIQPSSLGLNPSRLETSQSADMLACFSEPGKFDLARRSIRSLEEVKQLTFEQYDTPSADVMRLMQSFILSEGEKQAIGLNALYEDGGEYKFSKICAPRN